jgi:hypothetical protein
MNGWRRPKPADEASSPRPVHGTTPPPSATPTATTSANVTRSLLGQTSAVHDLGLAPVASTVTGAARLFSWRRDYWSGALVRRAIGRRILEKMKPARAATRRFLPTSPFKPPPPAPPAERFNPQDQVTHDTYGLGRVIRVEDDTAVVVDFGTQQVRIPTPCAKLNKL